MTFLTAFVLLMEMAYQSVTVHYGMDTEENKWVRETVIPALRKGNPEVRVFFGEQETSACVEYDSGVAGGYFCAIGKQNISIYIVGWVAGLEEIVGSFTSRLL